LVTVKTFPIGVFFASDTTCMKRDFGKKKHGGITIIETEKFHNYLRLLTEKVLIKGFTPQRNNCTLSKKMRHRNGFLLWFQLLVDEMFVLNERCGN
jgi:hypothetical protein